jgi:nuclear transport factor 2 (NTF2) superfamily protein
MEIRSPLPPFTEETATQKVRIAENGWNSRDPTKVSLAYTEDCRWRNRAEFIQGRGAIQAFLTRKWSHELDYGLIKELWLMMATTSQCVSNMNITTIPATGSGPAGTNSGSFPTTA